MSKVIINDIPVEAFKDATILEASKEIEDIYIPTLYYLNLESFNVEHRIGNMQGLYG